MDDLILGLGLLQLFFAGAGVVSVFRFRRPGMTLSDVFTAGPCIFIRPANYVRPDRSRFPRLMFAAFFVTCAAFIGAIWLDGNF